MLFYFLSSIGLLVTASTVFVVGTCYYFLVQSMLKKSKNTSDKAKDSRQHNLITLSRKENAQQKQNTYLAASL